MTSAIDTKLEELGITLPEAAAAAGNYVPYVVVGDMVYISGQLPTGPDGLIKGKLGDDTDVDAGAEAAKYCAIALLSQLKAACDGDLSRVARVVKLGGFVNSTPDFGDQPKVINGASDLMVAVFGDAGRHARAAVSAASLPFGVAVEIEGTFQIK
ncbi:RidA family protein [Yoonia sp. 208BN28-4]|uniref:RidA family protein n=1 Tax=Yoonia sp. 208BN28-4 TaxID=3126505 RepID=UPI003098949B